MLVGKLEDGKTFHIIRPGEEESAVPLSYCGKMFSARYGDLIEEVAEESVRERRLCKQCEKKLDAHQERLAARQEKWAVAVRAALDDDSITLDYWNRYFRNERNVSFYTDPETYGEVTELVPTYRYLVEHQENILAALLTAFVPVYDSWRALDYGLTEEEKSSKMPPVSSPGDFSALLRPACVIVSSVGRGGMRYVGYEFEASWYPEGGFGAMMWGEHVVAFGEGDTAVDDNAAQSDKRSQARRRPAQ